jgi:hypothetical protein
MMARAILDWRFSLHLTTSSAGIELRYEKMIMMYYYGISAAFAGTIRGRGAMILS